MQIPDQTPQDMLNAFRSAMTSLSEAAKPEDSHLTIPNILRKDASEASLMAISTRLWESFSQHVQTLSNYLAAVYASEHKKTNSNAKPHRNMQNLTNHAVCIGKEVWKEIISIEGYIQAFRLIKDADKREIILSDIDSCERSLIAKLSHSTEILERVRGAAADFARTAAPMPEPEKTQRPQSATEGTEENTNCEVASAPDQPSAHKGIEILSSEIIEEQELYVVKKELWKHSSHEEPQEIIHCYNKNGDSIGDLKTAQGLCDLRSIAPEKRTPGSCVCSIGKSTIDGRWYGWSHRAIHGFQIGDSVKEGDCTAKSLPVGFTAKTEEDCKRMAIAFAESVS